MTFRRLLTSSVAGITATALLAGCSNRSEGSTPPTSVLISGWKGPATAIAPWRQFAGSPGARPVWMHVGVTTGARVYVSEYNLSIVNEYAAHNRKDGPPTCSLSGQTYVNGLAVDGQLDLWVTDGFAKGYGETRVFAPSCGKELFGINDPDGQPGAVAFDTRGHVFVENIEGPPSNPLYPSVDVYRLSTKKKIATLRYSSYTWIWSDEALDRAGNLYVFYSDIYNKGHVIEFPGGKAPAQNLPIATGFPGGLTFDSSGNLLVGDQDASNVSVYAPPFTGSPIATFSLKAPSVPCRFDRSMLHLYCSDFTNDSVDVYAYDAAKPASTAYLYSFDNGIPPGANNVGIALAPP